MRIEQLKIFKFSELSEEAQARAINRWNDTSEDLFWSTEIIDSLLKIFDIANIKIKDYSIGAYCRSYLNFELDDQIKQLTGARAYAWIENNLFYKLRITRADWIKNRKNYLSYGKDYRQGKIPPCPLTGYYFDDTLIDSFKTNIFDRGYNLDQCFDDLFYLTIKELENEYDYQRSKEFLADHFELNDYEFLENGKIYY